MGKSKAGKSKGNVSAGVHSAISRKMKNAARREYMQSDARFTNQMKALHQGKDIVMTIENPNKEQTNKRYIRVKVKGKDYLNSLKNKTYVMKEAQ